MIDEYQIIFLKRNTTPRMQLCINMNHLFSFHSHLYPCKIKKVKTFNPSLSLEKLLLICQRMKMHLVHVQLPYWTMKNHSCRRRISEKESILAHLFCTMFCASVFGQELASIVYSSQRKFFM